MVKKATVRYVSLQTCLINLPLSTYGQLVSRQVTPQSLVVCLTFQASSSHGSSSSRSRSSSTEHGVKEGTRPQSRAYVGWSGMPARLVGGVAALTKPGQTESVEMDPLFAKELGLHEGAEVCLVVQAVLLSA